MKKITITEKQAIALNQLLFDTIQKLIGISTAKTRIQELVSIRERIQRELTKSKIL